ncbi:MAG: mucoidy inhibitor MuiA family protein [Deltaproteobacteria bacterium]|nr:mucoidy inhibitor MuiA family protein [Deltaproteobacteria bacterium]
MSARTRWSLVFGPLVATCALVAPALAETENVEDALPRAPSRLDHVTVYRGEALVTRVVEVPAGKGDVDVVVEGLPERVVPASLAARPDGKGVLVRAVRFQSRVSSHAPDPRIAALDEALRKLSERDADLRTALRNAERRQKLVESQATGWAVPTLKHDIGRGAIDPKKVAELNAHVFGLLDKAEAEVARLHGEQRALQRERQQTQRERNELVGGSRHRREAIITVARQKSGKSKVFLDYLVSSASWSPTYHMRLGARGDKVRVEYLAEVAQQSGEDWDGVALVLSTATPRMSAESPVLAPLWIQLQQSNAGKGKANKKLGGASYSSMQSNLRAQQRRLLADQDQGRAGWEVNKAAARSQRAEIAADRESVVQAREALRQAEETLAVSYALNGRLSLGSRRERQLVEIAAFELDAANFYEAVPLFSSYVNRYARVTNKSKVPLLAGPYSAWSEGEFVGRGSIGVVATGQDFVVGFGADPQLRCARELVDKKDETSWGTRTQTFDVRLRVESYKDRPVRVLLYDRIPATRDATDLAIKVASSGRPLSTDPVYLRDRKPAGILRWDLDVPAGSNGAKASDLRYRWEMAYGKDKHVGKEAAERLDLMRKDYEMMMH